MKTAELTLKSVALQAVFIVVTLGLMLVFPQAFHLFRLGPAFLPMFIPLIGAAFLNRSVFPMIVPALTAPFLSYALFGMPAWPVAAAIAAEMAFLAVALTHAQGLHAAFIPVYPLVLAAGRTVSFAVHVLILFLIGKPDATAAWTMTAAGWKGLIILLLTGYALFAAARIPARNER